MEDGKIEAGKVARATLRLFLSCSQDLLVGPGVSSLLKYVLRTSLSLSFAS